MNEVKDISKQPLIEWGGQAVITTAQLAEVYGTTSDNINSNFSGNKGRFTAGKHYILLTGEDLRQFKNHPDFGKVVAKNTSQLYLWTRRGASRHCKILGTDKAWEQFDYLEDNYFDRKSPTSNAPLTLQQQIQTIAKGTEELYQRVDKVDGKVETLEERFNRFEDDMPLFQIDTKDIQNAVRKKAVDILGGKDSGAYKDKSVRCCVFADIQCTLRRNFEVKRYDEIRHKRVDDALRVVAEYNPPLVLMERVQAANAR